MRMVKMQQFTPSPPRHAGHVVTRTAFSHRLSAVALPEEDAFRDIDCGAIGGLGG